MTHAKAMALTFGLLATFTCQLVWPNDQSAELARRASWQVPTAEAVESQLIEWLRSPTFSEEQREMSLRTWRENENLAGGTLERLIKSLAVVDERVSELYAVGQQSEAAHAVPELRILHDQTLPTWVRANLCLYHGIWLANHQLYDECHDLLSPYETQDVVDPAAFLFYRAAALHRRLEKQPCLDTLDRLLENEPILPKRFATVAKLMQADLKPLKPDSLDEISRLMDNIQVRLGHGRAGTRVRKEEDDVIAKLDKLIEQLEQQAQQASAASSSGQNSGAPTQPMQDSMPAGGSGPGNVDPKSLGQRTDWGNMAPKEREEALQELTKDLPSHYRDVIEEYFRKLARDRGAR